MAIKHYNLDTIDKRGATINLIFGERSNGKSYQVKHKKGIIPFLEPTTNYYDRYYNKGVVESVIKDAGRRFMLVRRYREEIAPALIEKYFDDVDVTKLTNGEADMIICYRGEIFLSVFDTKTNKPIKGRKIGYVVALSTEQKYAGGSFLDVTDIIFEEVMSRSLYLAHEPAKLMNLYSTIDRKRGIVRMWLVGNTISKICPYLTDWGILDIVRHMKQGEIRELWLDTGDTDDNGVKIEVKLALEYCEPTGASSFVIGEHKTMLNKGEWQSERQPHLSKSINEYNEIFRIMFYYKGFKFLASYIQDKVTKYECWYIAPYTKEIKSDIIVFSDIVASSPYYQRDIYNPLINNPKLKQLLQTFKESNIFYATDMCGTDFKQAIDFEIRK